MNVVSQSSFSPTQKDIDAVFAVVATLEHSQQNELVDEFVGLFLPNAVWTTGGGKRLEGRDVIEAFTRTVLPGAMAESTATYTPERIFFITPDVAVVNVLQQPVTLDGNIIVGQPIGHPTYVLYRQEGLWKIAAGQNTQVAED